MNADALAPPRLSRAAARRCRARTRCLAGQGAARPPCAKQPRALPARRVCWCAPAAAQRPRSATGSAPDAPHARLPAQALWKGNGVTIVHRLPYSGINFFVYERLMVALSAGRPGRHRDDASATAVARSPLRSRFAVGSAEAALRLRRATG